MKRAIVYLRGSLVFRVAIVYAVIAYVILQIVKSAVSSAWLPESSIRTTEILAIFYFLLSLYWASAIQLVSRPDRIVFLKQIAWVYGPAQLLTGPIFFGVVSIFLESQSDATSDLTFSAMLFLLLIAATAWMLLSARIARAWALEQAQDPWPLMKAEARFIGRVDQIDLESKIGRKTYYLFLASIAVFLIFVLETIVSEFIDDNFSTPGYIGALVAAMLIAALIYPIHRRAVRFIALISALEDDDDTEAIIENPVLVASEVAGATVKYYNTDVPRRWGCLVVLSTILISILLAVVKLHPYFNS